ncbi:hypothetical protein VP01_1004g6 [Puccinia sorghi]|uniref:Uncharacterized protein n=1 Tax=Puccinia sorghi TaxID=27349 RepID=A0A0L6VV76_9BASI|nr:hypothetical protein VP01_1004g6 [Puccinia sorghi]
MILGVFCSVGQVSFPCCKEVTWGNKLTPCKKQTHCSIFVWGHVGQSIPELHSCNPTLGWVSWRTQILAVQNLLCFFLLCQSPAPWGNILNIHWEIGPEVQLLISKEKTLASLHNRWQGVTLMYMWFVEKVVHLVVTNVRITTQYSAHISNLFLNGCTSFSKSYYVPAFSSLFQYLPAVPASSFSSTVPVAFFNHFMLIVSVSNACIKHPFTHNLTSFSILYLTISSLLNMPPSISKAPWSNICPSRLSPPFSTSIQGLKFNNQIRGSNSSDVYSKIRLIFCNQQLHQPKGKIHKLGLIEMILKDKEVENLFLTSCTLAAATSFQQHTWGSTPRRDLYTHPEHLAQLLAPPQLRDSPWGDWDRTSTSPRLKQRLLHLISSHRLPWKHNQICPAHRAKVSPHYLVTSKVKPLSLQPIWGERAVCPLLGPTNQTLPFLVQNGDGDVPHNGILLDFTFCGLVEPQPMDALKMSGWSQASKMVWTATTCSIRGFREQHRMPPVSMDMWGQEGPEQETLSGKQNLFPSMEVSSRRGFYSFPELSASPFCSPPAIFFFLVCSYHLSWQVNHAAVCNKNENSNPPQLKQGEVGGNGGGLDKVGRLDIHLPVFIFFFFFSFFPPLCLLAACSPSLLLAATHPSPSLRTSRWENNRNINSDSDSALKTILGHSLTRHQKLQHFSQDKLLQIFMEHIKKRVKSSCQHGSDRSLETAQFPRQYDNRAALDAAGWERIPNDSSLLDNTHTW